MTAKKMFRVNLDNGFTHQHLADDFTVDGGMLTLRRAGGQETVAAYAPNVWLAVFEVMAVYSE